jgi:hypothetical protein
VSKPYRNPTGLKLQYSAGTLTKEQRKEIPKSTRRNWKDQNIAISQFWIPKSGVIYEHENTVLQTVPLIRFDIIYKQNDSQTK